MSQIVKLAVPSALLLGGLFIAATPAAAEKSAEQIKCEKDGGTWSDKGNGHTFCFKTLPPMAKGAPSSGGTAVTIPAGAACGASVKPDPRPNSSQSGQTLRHAINTKGTGASGRSQTAAERCANAP